MFGKDRWKMEGRRSYVGVWKWGQRSNPRRLYCRKRVYAFLIDEIMMWIGQHQAFMGCCGSNTQTILGSLHLKT